MAQFDLFSDPVSDGFLFDCQADLLSYLNTRLVAPVLLIDRAPKPAGRLNPILEIDGETYAMVTQYAAALDVRGLGRKIASFADRGHEIMNAMDMLLTGV